MHGKHSLTAAVVAFVGPDGPRYYPGSLSVPGAEAIAGSIRASGNPAVAIPVHLRMPDPPSGFLHGSNTAPPRLIGIVRDDPFDEPRDQTVDSPDADVDDIEAAPQPESESADPEAGSGSYAEDGIVRMVASRFMAPAHRAGRWYRQLHPPVAAKSFAHGIAMAGMPVRLYDVAVDLDRGAVKVTPQPGWQGVASAPEDDADEDDSADAPAGDHADSMEPEPERLGDESTYLGTAEFERLPDRWTVWTLEVHPAARPELWRSFRTFKKALRHAEKIHAARGHKLSAVILGPGCGSVRVDNITLWPDAWVVRTITDEEVYPEADAICSQNGDPVTRELAVMMAERIAETDSYGSPACPIVFCPYRPESKGGAR